MNRKFFNNHGFTLMEIMLAISIFAAVVSMAYGSYNASFKVIHSAESQARLYEKSRVVMGLLTNDLQLFYQGNGAIFQGAEENLNGKRADSLAFSSTSHIKFDRDDISTGYALIGYKTTVSANEDEGLSLYRYDKIFLPGDEEQDEENAGLKVCDGIAEVRFQYFDKAGESYDEWDSEEPEDTRNMFPAMIQITLRFISPENPETDIVFKTGVVISHLDNAKGMQ